MRIKDYLPHSENKAKDKQMQNWRLLRITSKNISKTYNEYKKTLKNNLKHVT
jgi:hypothetical protein